MIKFCNTIYNYCRLIYSVYHYINLFNQFGEHNIILLDSIIERINKCGSVAIKLCQWITPKLEVMYLEDKNIIKNDKPLWLNK